MLEETDIAAGLAEKHEQDLEANQSVGCDDREGNPGDANEKLDNCDRNREELETVPPSSNPLRERIPQGRIYSITLFDFLKIV